MAAPAPLSVRPRARLHPRLGTASTARIAAAALAALAVLAAGRVDPALASSVTVLDGDRAVTRDDPHLPAVDPPPPPPDAAASRTQPPRARTARRRGPTVGRALAGMLARNEIDAREHEGRVEAYRRARSALGSLEGRRRAELAAVKANLDAIAERGQLTPSRLEPLFLTLERNRQWWTQGPLLANGRRVSFAGSAIVWQHYAGQGIEIQVLGTFGKANALWSARKDQQLRDLLEELVPLAADRGGSPVWEYYFRFGGGAPPWASGLAQGTAVQALARAASRLGEPDYADLARRAAGLFEQPPPTGVRVPTGAGAHYLIYSYARRLFVLNGFLQSVIGLHDLAELTGDPRARGLYADGEVEARRAVPRYDTGAWSRYSLERDADLGYHRLVTEFLDGLCRRTGMPVYCETAARFRGYERTAPVVSPSTTRIRTGRPALRADKPSLVTVSVIRGSRSVHTADVRVRSGGRSSTRWARPRGPGRYELRLTATDLAGNRTRAAGPLRVLPRR